MKRWKLEIFFTQHCGYKDCETHFLEDQDYSKLLTIINKKIADVKCAGVCNKIVLEMEEFSGYKRISGNINKL